MQKTKKANYNKPSSYIVSNEKLYTVDWSKSSGTVRVGEFDIPMPKKPRENMIKNYNKPLKDQIFRRERIPKNLKKWNERDRNIYIKQMWHKRLNGEWWRIGGQDYYINGFFWTFMNFWWMENGQLPIYRKEAWEFFTFFLFCYRDPDCYGFLDIKGRRCGDTEKTLAIIWMLCSMYRNFKGGMQNMTDKDASKNFARIVNAHKKMIWFFKPITSGSSDPKSKLEFNYPEEIFSRKKIKDKKKNKYQEVEYKYDPIDSWIDFESTVLGKYDGQKLGVYYHDEPGKVDKYDPKKPWGIVKPACALHNGRTIIGFGIFTTTVEAFNTGENVERMKMFWDQCDPNERNKNGRTVTGLYRLFRGAEYSEEIDKFGNYNVAETHKWIDNEIEGMMKKGDIAGVTDFSRKHPKKIEDVFKPPHDECILYPLLLEKRLRQIDTGKNWIDQPEAPKGLYGNLEWTNGMFSPVEWKPATDNLEKKWCISQHPPIPNQVDRRGGMMKPLGNGVFSFGADPVDHLAPQAQTGSDAAGVIKRKFDPSVDGHLMNKDGKIVEPWRMMTDQIVCDYVARPENPYEIYEDYAKMCIYYGCSIFPETDKPGVITWFIDNGLYHFILNRPKETYTNRGIKEDRKNAKKKNLGGKASTGLIQQWIDLLKYHVYSRIATYHHPRILKIHQKFNGQNRKFCDLTVGEGYCHLADSKSMKAKAQEYKERYDKAIFEMRSKKRRR